MKKYKAAIFDMDGTLLDTMYVWRHLSRIYLEQHHIPIEKNLEDQLVIMGIRKAAEFLTVHFPEEGSAETIHQELIKILDEYYCHHAVFKPGAERFLQKMRARRIPTMVFSATPEELIKMALTRLGAMDYFSCGLLSCSTIQSSKHHTEAFLKAAQHMNFAVEEIMVFEDALYAAATAKKAGFTLGIMADREETHVDQMRSLADFYMEESWDEFPIDHFF